MKSFECIYFLDCYQLYLQILIQNVAKYYEKVDSIQNTQLYIDILVAPLIWDSAWHKLNTLYSWHI